MTPRHSLGLAQGPGAFGSPALFDLTGSVVWRSDERAVIWRFRCSDSNPMDCRKGQRSRPVGAYALSAPPDAPPPPLAAGVPYGGSWNPSPR